jgi:CRISPR-associated protein Csm4
LRRFAVYGAERVPRVTVDRISSASTIYHAGRATFASGCGLWFGVHWRTPGAAWQMQMGQLLALLGDDGLGGERSSGYGGFTVDARDAFHLPDAHAGRPALLLSRYHPTAEEAPAALNHPAAAYGLSQVAGWLRSPDAAGQRRKRLMLVSEGSIVCPPRAPAGDVVDVRPDYASGSGVAHPVFRYGLALAVDASKMQEAVNG